MRERLFNHRGPLACSLPARSSFRQLGTRSTAIMVFVCSVLFASTVSAKRKFDESKLEFVDNGTIKLGVSPDLGGAITYLSKSGSDENIINNWDWGRQIQMSFFSGPVPYVEKGQTPKKHWEHIGWNPIQAGDDHGNGSKLVELRKKDTSIYVKLIPMQWPLNNIPGECTYESWLELKGNTVQVRCRLNNARSDKTQYPGRHQELPAVYTNGEYYRLMTYRGDRPFTGDKLTRIPKKSGGGFPWEYWLATENWAALVNDDNWGLGIYKPDNCLFIGGFAGKEGIGGTNDSPTGYIAPLHTEILDHNITYDYEFALILGSLNDIRGYALKHGKDAVPPDWKFEQDRQHWRYHAAGGKGTDAGWPIEGFIQLDLGKPGMAAVSPPTLWQADDAPVLHIDAAFKTSHKKAMVAWTQYKVDSHNPSHTPESQLQFDIVGDGKFRTYTINLASKSSYTGALSYLMFKPVLKPEKDGWVKVKRIWFGTESSSQAGRAEIKVWKEDYVPPPEPVESTLTLGTYVFPGWYRDEGRGDYPYRTHDEDSEWKNAVAKQPKPRPLLGFYDDSLPEVNDWHIKWALEHGISFFAFDWYWNAGEKRLARTLERGFLKARHRDQMKFCVLWCNHYLDWKGKSWRDPDDLDFGREALLEMMEYLADNYFKLPNYLAIEGRPVVMILWHRQVVDANGGPAGFKRVLGEMNDVLRSRGIKDLYLVSMPGGARAMKEAGFEASSGYAHYGTDPSSRYVFKKGHSIPYEDMVTHYESVWKRATADKVLPYIVPIGSNWDDRPRAKENGRVITGKTPEKFRLMLRNSLKYLDKDLNMAVIEAWNEWGEGSFIEPDEEWGFGFLDVIREEVTDAPARHINHVPTREKILSWSMLNEEELAQAKALEEQPYPDPPVFPNPNRVKADQPLPDSKPLKAWEFAAGQEKVWHTRQVEPLKIKDGHLSTVVTGSDPQLVTNNIGVAIADIECIALRLKVSNAAPMCQLFWTTTEEPATSEQKSFRFYLGEDKEWHTYQIFREVGETWSGTLKTLRFDIGRQGDEIEVDWIRVYEKE